MKHAGKIVLMAVFLTLMTGCAPRKARVKTPSTAQAPTTNDKAGVMYPSPFPQTTEAPSLPAPQPTQAKETPPPPPPSEHKPRIRKKNPATVSKSKPPAAKPVTPASAPTESATPATAPATTPAPGQQAAVEPSGVSPIGQLSSGEGAAGSQKRHETSDLINTTEQGLNGIKRTLSTGEQETATQIRTYLKQAKQALTVDDIDGASTLATKAKLLLEELTKP